MAYTSAQIVQAVPTGINSALVLIKTATVTSVANTGSTWQSVLTSTYTNYLFIGTQFFAANNNQSAYISLYYSGTTEQTTGYYGGVSLCSIGGVTSRLGKNNASSFNFMSSVSDAGASSSFILNIANVGTSTTPTFTIQANGSYSAIAHNGAGTSSTARTYDGFLIKPGAGNITLTGSLYGYTK